MANPKPMYVGIYVVIHIAFLVCATLAGGVAYLLGAPPAWSWGAGLAVFAALKTWLWWSTR